MPRFPLHISSLQRRVLTQWGIALILVSELIVLGFTYARGYQGLTSDDPALAVTGARYLYEQRTTRFPNPLAPLLQNEFYSNFIASEYPVHTALAQLYMLTGVEHILTVTNIFMVGVFVASGLTLFALFTALTRSAPLSILGVGFLLTSRWYGLSFWTGHYAQMLAYLLLPIVLLGLVRFEQERRRRWLMTACLCTLLLFPIHSLSFLVATSAVLSVLLVHGILFTRSRRLRLLLGISALLALVAAVLIVKTRFTNERYYPLFSVEDVSGGGVAGILRLLLPEMFATLLVLVGVIRQLQERHVALLSWFLVTYVLVNSGFLNIPFFQYRFIEFMSTPLWLLGAVGLRALLQEIRLPALRWTLVAGLTALVVPLNVDQQLQLRACHVRYCVGLHPVSLLPEDEDAFAWVREHTPPDSIIIAVPKFGVYLPALGLRRVDFPVGTPKAHNDAYVVMTGKDTAERWRSARAVGASYVLWDGVFTRYGASYTPYQQYTEHFNDARYFRRVYDRNGVRLYQIL